MLAHSPGAASQRKTDRDRVAAAVDGRLLRAGEPGFEALINGLAQTLTERLTL